jgi:hypothetical protein
MLCEFNRHDHIIHFYSIAAQPSDKKSSNFDRRFYPSRQIDPFDDNLRRGLFLHTAKQNNTIRMTWFEVKHGTEDHYIRLFVFNSNNINWLAEQFA